MVANTKISTETAIGYGVIPADSLDPKVVSELQMVGLDLHWAATLAELKNEIAQDVERGELALSDADDAYACREERLTEIYNDDKPVHSFEFDGVTGRTSWLDGRLFVWVFHSPWRTTGTLCSPCVATWGDLGTLVVNENREGYECYDVPPSWRKHDK